MSASKYLPPFTAAERVTVGVDRVGGDRVGGDRVGGDRPVRHPVEPARPVTGTEATYADFLGDEVDE